MRYNTIIGGPARANDPQTIEGIVTTSALKPGSLVVAGNGTLAMHTAAGVRVPAIVALANHLGGQDVRENTAVGETGVAVICDEETTYHVLVNAGVAIVRGDQLCSAGDGSFKKVSVATDAPLFWAFETVTIGATADFVAVRKI